MPAVCAILIMLVVVALLIGVRWQYARGLSDTFARLASDLHGRLIPAAWLSRPAVEFKHGDIIVRVDTFSTGGRHPRYYTQCHLPWPGGHLRCEVYPEDFLRHLGKAFLGTQDLEIGAPRFDADYIIRGNDLAAIREFLTPAVQGEINTLRQFLGNDDIYIAVYRGKLLVKKLGLMTEYDNLERFVTMALALHDQAMSTQFAGIDFIEQAADAAGAAQPVCQICGEDIAGEMVFCKSCKTPHHKECWEYFGACSTYGCGQTRYVPART